MNGAAEAAAAELEEYARMVGEARKALDDAMTCYAVAVRQHERAIVRLREAR